MRKARESPLSRKVSRLSCRPLPQQYHPSGMIPTATKAATAYAKPAAPISGAEIEMARAKMVKMTTLVKRPEDSTLSKRFLTARLLPRLSTMGMVAASFLLTKAEGWGAKALELAHTQGLKFGGERVGKSETQRFKAH